MAENTPQRRIDRRARQFQRMKPIRSYGRWRRQFSL